jgi:transposase-like protein
MDLFPDEESCAHYLEDVRWPDGFICQYCGWQCEPYRFENRPGVLRCSNCQRDTSLTADTVMERTHTPLSVWFWGAYLVTSLTPGMSATQFQRQLGLKRYETAFQILHKLRAGMIRPDRDRIGGDWPVEMDEVWIGGRTRGEGRGEHHKTLVVGAVESRKGKAKDYGETSKATPRCGGVYAGRLRLHVVPDRSAKSLEAFATDSVKTDTLITTDDWSGYDNLFKIGFKHRQVAMRGDPEAAEQWLPLIHLIFSNLKTWLLGIHHGVSPQHLQAYLNEFAFRFNRRFYPFNAFRSLLGIAADAEAPTYEELYSGEWAHPNPDELEEMGEPEWGLHAG